MYIELQRMAPTGEAIGQHDGLVIFVPFGMPGDKIEAEITFRRKNYARARITRILHPSPQRVPPPCQYFGLCGGCEWQHIPASSDPATLACDARIICDRGYSLTYIQPLDMFPQTQHVETVALFSRTAA